MGSYVARRLVAIGALAFGITLAGVPHHPADPRRPGHRHARHQCRRPRADRAPAPAARPGSQHSGAILVWLGNVLHGDFGYSYGQQQSVASLIAAEHAGDDRADGGEPGAVAAAGLRDRRDRGGAAQPGRRHGRHGHRAGLHVDPELLAGAAADPAVRGAVAVVRRRGRHLAEGARAAGGDAWRWGRPGSMRGSSDRA